MIIMKIEHEGKELKLMFTFNSFMYMQELDLQELETLEATPFKILGVTQTLMRGALNYDPRNKFNNEDVVDIIEKVMDDGELMELLEFLLEELQKSSFFKNLQEEKKSGIKITKKK